jgi:integrase
MAHGRFTDPKLGKIRFRKWVEEWWETTVNLCPSTRERDHIYLRKYILPDFGDVPLSKISQLEVRKWVASLDAEGYAPATVKKAYQILGKIMRSAVDAGLILDSPCRGIELPEIEVEEMRFLTPEEVARLANSIDPRYRALVLVAAYGGLRWGELAGLRRDRFNGNTGEVEIVKAIVELNGRLLPPGPPKTKAGRRTVKLPRSVADELSAHIALYRVEEGDLIVQSPEGGPLRKTFRQRFWLPAVRAAGVEPLRIHDLRHTAIAFWIAVGADPKRIASRAGHTSVAVVLDRYGHLFPEGEEKLAERLDVVFRAAGTPKRIQPLARKALPGSDERPPT